MRNVFSREVLRDLRQIEQELRPIAKTSPEATAAHERLERVIATLELVELTRSIAITVSVW